MPQVESGDLVILRTTPVVPPKAQYISVADREVIYSGTVGTVYSDPNTLAYVNASISGTSGTAADTFPYMTIDFGSTPGAHDIGRSRMRRDVAGGAGIYFAETAPSKLPIQSGDKFTIYKEFTPYPKLPYGEAITTNGYTSSILLRMDYDEFYSASQNANILPKANITRSATSLYAPKPAYWKDSGQTYRTMVLSSAQSFAVATGASIASRLWDVADGTITSGTSASTTITVRFPVGFRYVKLTVTDSNGTSSWMYFPIWVHDETYMPLTNFHVTRDSTSQGREMDFDFFAQDTSETSIPKGVALCYWEEPDFHGEEVPENYRDQFYGWCAEDTTIFRKDRARTSLSIKGVAWWLSQFRGTSQRLSDKGTTPTTWFEMQNITVDRVAYFVLQNMTTVNHICNLFLSGETSILKSLDITLGNQWQQLSYIVSGYYGRIGADSLNGLWIRKHYSYMTNTERAAVDPVISLTSYDWRDESPIQIMRRYYEPIGYVRAGGASYSGGENTLYASAAPGRTMYHGASETEAPGQNLPSTNSQDVLNFLTGSHYAYINNPRESVNLELLFNLDVIEPAWLEPVLISTTDSDSGLVLNEDEFLVKEVSITYENPHEGRGKIISWTMEGVTTGVAGQMLEVPEDVVVPPDRWPVIPEVVIPPISVSPDDLIPDWTNQMPINGVILSAVSAKFARMTAINTSTGAITYDENNTGLSGNGIWYRSDPYDYRRGFALTENGLYRCNNITNNSAWSQVATNAQMFGNSSRRGYKLLMSHMVRGWIMALCGNSGAGVSFDYGASWTQVAIDGGTAAWSNSASRGGDACLAPRNANHVYSIVQHPSALHQKIVYYSTNGGLNWTARGGTHPSDGGGAAAGIANLEIPYTREDGSPNVDDSSLELGWVGWSTGTQARLLRSFDRCATWGTYAGESGEVKPVASSTGSALHFFTHDSDYFSHTRRANTLGNTGVYYATDGAGGSSLFLMGNGTTQLTCINGWSMNPNVLVAFSRSYRYSFTVDAGATVYTPALPSGWSDGVAYVEFSLWPFISPA